MSITKDNPIEKKAKIEKIKSPEGCHDILPDGHKYITLIKKVIRRRSRQHGISRFTPCIFEHSKLFERSIGASTDIVSKELFTFQSKSGKHTYALRPEFTAGTMRSYIEHGMSSLPQPVKIYSLSQVFRHDSPQKNRYRQFHQWSVEVIGEKDPGIDAQLIHLAYQVLKDLKVEENIVVNLNTIGNLKEREKYIDSLRNYFYGKERNLCFDCQERLKKNPLRILDCKEEDCKILADLAPKFSQFIGKESIQFFNEVKELLEEVNVPYEVNEKLVRGLDYYNDTVFEIVEKKCGQQDTLVGGGRYDGLAEILGAPPTPASGFAMGIERVVNRMKDYGYKIPVKDKMDVFIAHLGKAAKKKSMSLLEKLHNEGVKTMGAIGTKSIRSQLKDANKFNVDWAIILGQIEVQEGNAILRNMKQGTQETISFDQVVNKLVELIGPKKLDKVDFFELNSLKKVDKDENWGI